MIQPGKLLQQLLRQLQGLEGGKTQTVRSEASGMSCWTGPAHSRVWLPSCWLAWQALQQWSSRHTQPASARASSSHTAAAWTLHAAASTRPGRRCARLRLPPGRLGGEGGGAPWLQSHSDPAVQAQSRSPAHRRHKARRAPGRSSRRQLPVCPQRPFTTAWRRELSGRLHGNVPACSGAECACCLPAGEGCLRTARP